MSSLSAVIDDLNVALSDAKTLTPAISTVIADLQKALSDAQSIGNQTMTYTYSQVGSPLAPLIDTASWQPYAGISPKALIADITNTWNGGAFDYSTGTMYLIANGGHADSWVNQRFSCDVKTGTWTRLGGQTAWPPDQHVPGYAPTYLNGTPTNGNGYEADGKTPVTPWANGAVMYFDGQRASHHNYGGTLWLPTQKAVLGLSGSTWHSANADWFCGWYDPTTDKWTRKGNLPINYNGISAAYDSVRDVVYWNREGTSAIYKYDPAADTHTKIGPPLSDPLSGDFGPFVSNCCDGACDYLYATIRNGWLGVNPKLPATYANAIVRMKLGQTGLQHWEPVTMTGDTSIVYSMSPGFEYDPDLNAFVLWSPAFPSSLCTLDLTTFALTTVPIAGTAPTAAQLGDDTWGTWGRFRRVSPGLYCVMVSANAPMYLITAS